MLNAFDESSHKVFDRLWLITLWNVIAFELEIHFILLLLQQDRRRCRQSKKKKVYMYS